MSQAISDRYGLPLSTSSSVAAEHYVEAIDAIISQNYGAGRHLGMAVEIDDAFAMGHATLAMASMFGYDPVKAKGHLADTHARAAGISHREQQQIDIIDTWINGNSPRALQLIREHLKDFPRDIVLLRLAQRLFVAGCSGSGVAHYPPDFYNMMKAVAADYGDDWAFQGQYAWATHEVGMLDEGLRLAERSLELRPTNAVAGPLGSPRLFRAGRSLLGGRLPRRLALGLRPPDCIPCPPVMAPSPVPVGHGTLPEGGRPLRERHPPLGDGLRRQLPSR